MKRIVMKNIGKRKLKPKKRVSSDGNFINEMFGNDVRVAIKVLKEGLKHYDLIVDTLNKPNTKEH